MMNKLIITDGVQDALNDSTIVSGMCLFAYIPELQSLILKYGRKELSMIGIIFEDCRCGSFVAPFSAVFYDLKDDVRSRLEGFGMNKAIDFTKYKDL